MVSFANIACKTIGLVGLGQISYDAYCVTKAKARNAGVDGHSQHIEKVFYDTRSINETSMFSREISRRSLDLRSRNPLPTFFAKVKGGITGFLYSLGTNLFTVEFSTLALFGKNRWGKVGAIGTAISLAAKILRNGFAVGKKNPMN